MGQRRAQRYKLFQKKPNKKGAFPGQTHLSNSEPKNNSLKIKEI
jgi:hypothetical protein